MNWETLLCFGDSITIGARSYLGYPEICGSILVEKLNKDWNVINHATNDFTTIDLVRSIDNSLANLKEVYPSLIIILIGTNDVKQNTNIKDFKIAYKQLIIKVKLLGVNNNILIMKLPFFTKKVFYPYNYSMNKNIVEFNSIITDLAQQSNLRIFEFSLKDEDFFDGVHLSLQGCINAGKQLANFILKDKGFESTTDMP